MSEQNKRGGRRENSGAKPKPTEEVASVRIVANVTPAEAAEWQRRGRTTWLRAELRNAGNEILSERESCVKVVESFLDPEIDSNTSYADEVCDGLLRQVIEKIRFRGHGAASLPETAYDNDKIDLAMRNDADETARPSYFIAELRAESIERQEEADQAAHGYHMDATGRLLCGGMVSCGSVFPYPLPLSTDRS